MFTIDASWGLRQHLDKLYRSLECNIVTNARIVRSRFVATGLSLGD